jgi:hypothetical protein
VDQSNKFLRQRGAYIALGWFFWWIVYISLLIMPHQFSFSLSITSALASAYNIQSTVTSTSVTSVFSLSVSITISDLTILEFIS